MKKNYESPKFNVITFDVKDVIAVSVDNSNPGIGDGGYEDGEL